MRDLNPFEPGTREAWEARARKEAGGRELDALAPPTEDGIPRRVVYTAADAPSPAPAPGFYPFIRGRDRRGFGCVPVYADADAEVLLGRVEHDAALGADAILVRGDPAQNAGFAHGGEGADLKAVAELAGRLDDIPILMHGGFNALEAHEALVRTRPACVAGGVLADPMGAWMRHGKLKRRLRSAYQPLAELVSAAEQRGPSWRCFGVDLVLAHEAGATAVSELALALGSGVELLRRMEEVGISPDRVAPRIVFLVAAGPRVFEEAAKLRALRRVWAAASGACGIGGDGARAFLHVTSSSRVISRRQPWLNLLRTSACAVSAVTGCADLLGMGRFDDALGSGSRLGDRLATNAHIVLREEGHLDAVLDPGGGSHYLESLTEALAEQAWERFQAVEKSGGLVASLRRGDPQRRAAEAAAARVSSLSTGARVMVGVSRFAADESGPTPAPEFDTTQEAGVPDFDAVEAIKPFIPLRDDDAFEAVTERTAELHALVVGLGPLREHTARVDRAADVLRVGGLQVETTSLDALEDGAMKSRVVVVTGTDERLAAEAGAVQDRARAAGAAHVVTDVARFAEGSDVLAFLSELLSDGGAA
jgi:methylmalonyl-CoA mutase